MKKQIIKAWIGFVNGKIDYFKDENYYNGVKRADLFKTKKGARECYDDVRKVEIKVIK